MNAITLNMTATTAGAGDNSEGRLDKILGKMSLLGKAEALGKGSRRDAGIALTEAAYAGDIDEDDAEACYDKYQLEAAKLSQKKHLTGGTDNPKSRTAQISKFRAFIKIGAMPDPVDGREVLARAVAIAEQLSSAGTKVLSDFEALRTVCVAQVAKPSAPLTDEEIAASVSKPEAGDKDLLAKLVAAYKTAYKINTEAQMQETQDIVDSIATAIRAIDEDAVPAMTKEEKAEMAFMAEARKRGMA